MFATSLDMQLLAALTAIACAIPGVFLILRRMALISDAISHVILLGIVLAFFVVRDLKSPWLMLGAALGGVGTVALVELLQRTKLVREDAAIGLVYPAMFSLAVLLIKANHLQNVHLDIDAVLVGNLNAAASRKLAVGGWWLPTGSLIMSIVAGLNLLFVAAFYKELKLSTFDAGLAATLGFAPVLLNYVLMALVSLTAVASFDSVGPVLVVPLMVVPPATAYLLSDRLSRVLALSAILAVAGALGGFWVAQWADASFAGAMASVLGLEFVAAWFLAPKRGLASMWFARRQRRRDFLQSLLAVHLLHHEGTPAETVENQLTTLHEHMRWAPRLARQVARDAENDGLVSAVGDLLKLTAAGRERARSALALVAGRG